MGVKNTYRNESQVSKPVSQLARLALSNFASCEEKQREIVIDA